MSFLCTSSSKVQFVQFHHLRHVHLCKHQMCCSINKSCCTRWRCPVVQFPLDCVKDTLLAAVELSGLAGCSSMDVAACCVCPCCLMQHLQKTQFLFLLLNPLVFTDCKSYLLYMCSVWEFWAQMFLFVLKSALVTETLRPMNDLY